MSHGELDEVVVGRAESRDTVFETALEAVLDGIERRFAAGPT